MTAELVLQRIGPRNVRVYRREVSAHPKTWQDWTQARTAFEPVGTGADAKQRRWVEAVAVSLQARAGAEVDLLALDLLEQRGGQVVLTGLRVVGLPLAPTAAESEAEDQQAVADVVGAYLAKMG